MSVCVLATLHYLHNNNDNDTTNNNNNDHGYDNDDNKNNNEICNFIVLYIMSIYRGGFGKCSNHFIRGFFL